MGLVDDAAIFPPGEAPLEDAYRAHHERRREWYADLVGPLVVRDTDLGSIAPGPALAVVLTGGAGAVVPALTLARRKGHRVSGIETALRDVDDLVGNTRRVAAALDAAAGEGLLDDELLVHVEIPATDEAHGLGRVPYPLPSSWLAAADEVAAAGHRLKFRTGGPDDSFVPSPERLAAQIGAALDRETPFKCTAGLHHAVRHEGAAGWQHGFLNVLLATLAAWDSADARTVQLLLAETNADVVAEEARRCAADLPRARRWFTSFGSCSIDEPLADLVDLGLAAPDPSSADPSSADPTSPERAQESR